MTKRYMAIDQHGHAWHGLEHPRKDLMRRIGSSHAEKIYRDGPDGPEHCGYVIGGLWLEVYEVTPWHVARKRREGRAAR